MFGKYYLFSALFLSMLLVKLGGSVITDKNEYKKFREDVTRKIVEELPQENLIIVHGGGSFGHVLAHKYNITEGFEENKKMGFARIGVDMMELNLKILKILHEHSIPAISIVPHAFHIFEKEINLDLFEEYLSLGFVPVTYGDIILDKKQGINICSGDYLMLHLARRFQPEKVIFLTDVDGIYNKNPKEYGAKLIPVLRRDYKPGTDVNVMDVTGGMEYKIEMMREIARHSKVYVINGFYPERLGKVLRDEEFLGTVVE